MSPPPTERNPPPSRQISVLLVNTDLRVGGQEGFVVELVRRLDRSRFRPLVACLREPGALGPRVLEAGVPLVSGLARSGKDPRALWRLARLVRRERIDIVCTVGCGDKMFWGRLAGRLGGARAVVALIRKTRSAAGGRILERPNRWLTPITDRFVAVAESAARYLVEEEGLPAAKVSWIHNGVDPERFCGAGREEARRELGLTPQDLTVVHVAVLRPEKGHDVLLAAAREVLREVPRARFLLAGEGPARVEIEGRVRAAGLGGAVRLLGHRDDVERVLAAGDLAVLSSHPRVEAFPNAVLQAMASGLPVVSTDVGSVREMIEDGVEGRLVPPGDPPALAAALRELLADGERRQTAGARARERVLKQFTSERMARAYEDLFMGMLAPAEKNSVAQT